MHGQEEHGSLVSTEHRHLQTERGYTYSLLTDKECARRCYITGNSARAPAPASARVMTHLNALRTLPRE